MCWGFFRTGQHRANCRRYAFEKAVNGQTVILQGNSENQCEMIWNIAGVNFFVFLYDILEVFKNEGGTEVSHNVEKFEVG